MTDVLGYSSYLTYGEDLTANVSDLVAATHPEAVAGIVVTHAHFLPQDEREATTDPTERAFYDRMAAGWYEQAGYAHVQGTRPDTLAAALNDSPAGLLAWITEKLVEWSDTPRGRPGGRGAAHLARPDPHRGHPVLGDAEHRHVVPDVLRRGRRRDPAGRGPGRGLRPAARARQPRVGRAAVLPRPAGVRAAARGRPLHGRRGTGSDGGAGAAVRSRLPGLGASRS